MLRTYNTQFINKRTKERVSFLNFIFLEEYEDNNPRFLNRNGCVLVAKKGGFVVAIPVFQFMALYEPDDTKIDNFFTVFNNFGNTCFTEEKKDNADKQGDLESCNDGADISKS